MDTIEQVREFFKGDVFAGRQGIVIDSINDGEARCSVVLDDSHRNAMGSVQGGLIYTLADFTFAVATNMDGQATVTLGGNISYLRQPEGSSLLGVSSHIHSTKNTCVYDVNILDEYENLVACCRFTGYRVSGVTHNIQGARIG